MHYRAVGTRCAVDLTRLGMRTDRAAYLLESVGFREVHVDLNHEARSLLGKPYKKRARLSDAPDAFDCSLLVKWLHALKGIWIPRLAIQQHEFGSSVEFSNLRPGDAIYTNGPVNLYTNDPAEGVGHAAFATSAMTVIHAASFEHGVIESPLEQFLRERSVRGVRRFFEPHVRTFEAPPTETVEWSDDLTWIIRRESA